MFDYLSYLTRLGTQASVLYLVSRILVKKGEVLRSRSIRGGRSEYFFIRYLVARLHQVNV